MNKIENYLKTTPKRQIYLIYFMIFGLIFYGFIQIVMPIKEDIETSRSQINELQVKLTNNSLRRLKKQKIKKNRELLSLKSKKDKQKEEINYLISGLYKLKYAFYDDKEWAKSIDNILQYSLKRNLKIDYIKSAIVNNDKNSGLIEKKRSMEISGSGAYVDIVAFISYIDNLNTLLKFEKMQIKLDEKELTFKLSIDMYGIGL